MDLNFNNLMRNVDLNSLNNMNPLEMLGQLGMSTADASSMMNGDYSPLQQGPAVLDYYLIIKRYKNCVNANLINYFFKKAKFKKEYTEDELEAYKEAWNNWFKLVFELGKNHIFRLSEELEDSSLIIKKEEEYYQITIFKDIKQINYLGNKI